MRSLKPSNLFFLVLLFLALPGMAMAQRGGGGGGGQAGIGTAGSSANNRYNTVNPATTNPNDTGMTTYRSVTGTIVELNPSENSVSVKNKKDGKVTIFLIVPKTKIKAEKNTELADKKNIKLEDFKPGETVEVSYSASGSVTELRLKHDKEKKESDASAQKSS